jgi:anti-sigma B factor antagonist
VNKAAEETMKIRSEVIDNVSVIRVEEGRIDIASSAMLKSYLLQLIENGNSLICIDMSKVKFIDSTGLGVLVTVLKRMGQNGSIALWGLSREVKTLFELTQLYKIFELFENENDAIQKLNHHAAR